jgi:calcium-dependent protein kinase
MNIAGLHRDLKLENFLFQTEDPDSPLRMIDFGLSKHFEFGREMLHDAVGTPYSVAPETILGNYDEKADVWAIGVISFLLLCGDTPFGGACGEDLGEVRDNILRGRYAFEPKEAWDLVSDEGKGFVRTLLTVNPKRRPTAKEAQRHPWIQKWARKDCKEGTKLNPTTVNAIVAFKELTDMQKLLSEVLSYTLLPEQIAGLREDFEKIDNGDGEITLSALRNVLMENAESGSLGALTEREVEEIFQALRVRKTDTTIRWHEFIAGGLSQCEIDDRNLRLAFDRLDTDGKGFITFDDILDLMGTDGADEEESLQVVWNDATKQCNGGFGRRVLTYDDFVLLMKGQGEEIGMCSGSLEEVTSSLRSLQGSSSFLPIPEGEILEEDEKEEDITLSDDKRKDFRRMRSRSLGGEGPSSSEGGRKSPASFVSPGRYNSDVHSLIKDASQSPLVRNRSLYRAHRELRLAVLEASKRFEEKRANRVKATLLVTQGPSSAGHSSPGLIVRNESLDKPKSVLDHQTDLENASHRGGRHRERRIKTVSDMSVLLR